MPGEPEFRHAEEKRAEGIEIDDTTWSHIRDAVEILGLSRDGGLRDSR